MAINFAAANMAGYNNPQIEVFTVIPTEDGTSLEQYPDESIILNCINRGSLPVIMLRLTTAGYLLLLSDWDAGNTGTTIVFSTPSGISGSTTFQIIYPDNGGTPLLQFE